MIEIPILKGFNDMGFFKTLCEDYSGIVKDNTIVSPLTHLRQLPKNSFEITMC